MKQDEMQKVLNERASSHVSDPDLSFDISLSENELREKFMKMVEQSKKVKS